MRLCLYTTSRHLGSFLYLLSATIHDLLYGAMYKLAMMIYMIYDIHIGTTSTSTSTSVLVLVEEHSFLTFGYYYMVKLCVIYYGKVFIHRKKL